MFWFWRFKLDIQLNEGKINKVEAVRQCCNQYMLAFDMVENILNTVSDVMYLKKAGGHVFWQQILHALMGTHFWFRTVNNKFIEPFLDKKYYPEMEKDPENLMLRDELKDFSNTIRKQVLDYFNLKDDEWLFQSCVLYSKLSNFEIISMQIRHLMYHVGYLNGLLNEYSQPTISWLEYFG